MFFFLLRIVEQCITGVGPGSEKAQPVRMFKQQQKSRENTRICVRSQGRVLFKIPPPSPPRALGAHALAYWDSRQLAAKEQVRHARAVQARRDLSAHSQHTRKTGSNAFALAQLY